MLSIDANYALYESHGCSFVILTYEHFISSHSHSQRIKQYEHVWVDIHLWWRTAPRMF